jgi:hypothetical protein
MEIKDSGARREFESGAVRDIADGKGRCDLLPLDVVAAILDAPVLDCINDYVRTGDTEQLNCAILHFIDESDWEDVYTAMLEVAKQYEDGCKKYGDRNWEKGQPLHVFIDSGVRHYLKFKRGDTDEPHGRAFVWNILGAIWTQQNKPEMIDLPFKDVTPWK